MSDLIERQAAVEAARKCSVKEVTPDYMLIDKAEIMTDLMMLPTAQPEEAISVAWITARIERLKGMGNMRADFMAETLQTTLNKWRKEQEGETT